MKHKNNIIRLLSLIAALIVARAKAEETENKNSFLANMPFNVNIEKTEAKPSFGEITLKPGAVWKNEDLSVEARWNAYRAGTTDGNTTDWITTKLYTEVNYKDWMFKMGEFGINAPYVAFLHFPRTPHLDNQLVGLGDNACFSGLYLQENKTGFGLGLVRNDTEISLKRLDNVLLCYRKDWGAVGATVYAALNRHNVDRAGATVIYRATDKTSIVADWIYKNNIHTGVLGLRQQFTDKFGASAVGEVVDVGHNDPSKAVSASLDYQVNKNCALVVVGRHDFTNKDTSLGIAFKISGILECEKQNTRQ